MHGLIFLNQINQIKMTKIYYNDIFIDEENKVIEIYKGCEYVEVEDSEVDDLVEEMFDWGEWNAFIIPSKVKDFQIVFN